jgi:chemotaxis response regulator CheB
MDFEQPYLADDEQQLMGDADHNQGGHEPAQTGQTFIGDELATLLEDDHLGLDEFIEQRIRLEQAQEPPGVPLAPQHGKLVGEDGAQATEAYAPLAGARIDHRVNTPAASTSQAEALLTPLMGLGYTQKQANAIKPENRAEVIKHHRALAGLKFNHAQTVKISQRGPSLAYVAHEEPLELFHVLPDLTDDQFVDVATSHCGNLKLEQMLSVAQDLQAKPLELSTEQLVKIAKRGGRPALQAVHSLGLKLIKEPYNLSSNQVVAIANNNGGKQALEAVKKQLLELIDPEGDYQLTRDQVVAIASNIGGRKALEAVKKQLLELIDPEGDYQLTRDQVLAIASNDGGTQALETVKKQLLELIDPEGDYQLTRDQVVAIASKGGGKQALEAVKKQLLELIDPEGDYQLTRDQVVAIANNKGGKQALAAVKEFLPELIKEPYNLSIDAVVATANRTGGRQAVELKQQFLEFIQLLSQSGHN